MLKYSSVESCSTIPNVDYGSVSVTSDGILSVARFACDVGHTLVGERLLTCNASGFWNSSVPICSMYNCFILHLCLQLAFIHGALTYEHD